MLATTTEELSAIIDRCWEAVNKSKIGPILREVVIKQEDEKWRPDQEATILCMSAYETYKIVLASQLAALTNKP